MIIRSTKTREMAIIAGATMAALATAGCGNSTGPESIPNSPDYNPQIPAAWAAAVSNPYFSLVPGTIADFAGQTAEGLETTTVEILSDTRMVNGVTATVVRDRVYLDGDLIEDTYDWYAQDEGGNVWYLGEDSKEIENGEVVSTEGSWEWAVDGALPGIIMWADPAAHMGAAYRQEFYEGEAEDWAKITALGESVVVPYGSFENCVRIEEWNGLEPGHVEHKFYAPQIGVVLEVPVGGSERVELVDFRTP